MQGKAFLLSMVLFTLIAGAAIAGLTPADLPSGISTMPLVFTPNVGQWDSRVLYRADGGGATVWFTQDGAYLQFVAAPLETTRPTQSVIDQSGTTAKGTADPLDALCEVIKLDFVGADPASEVEPTGTLDYKCNFFLGNDRARWRTDVPSYREITYREIYPGIDLRYYSNDGLLEYEFVVAPGADPAPIRMRYLVANALQVDADGNLIAAGKIGQVTEMQPLIYQGDKRGDRAVAGRFQLLDDKTFTFALDGRRDAALPTVIDPMVKFSTYLGGSSVDEAHSIDVSASGNAYVTGYTNSADFPTLNGYDNSANGSNDIFLTKFAPGGNTLVYSTYIGGSGADVARDVDEDGYGEAVLTGFTQSANFPLSSAYDNTLGGTRDAFLTRVNSAGNGLVVSTYHGGSGSDDGFGVYADGNNFRYYITGFTASSDLYTLSAYDATANGGNDVFVAKFGALGGIVYSTYVCGSGSDVAWELKPDASGNAYVTGLTNSGNFPTVNPYDASANGSNDVFVFKLASTGSTLTYSTYIGGNGNDQGLGIDVDNSGAAVVTGLTNNGSYPTAAAYDNTHNGSYDCFLTKLNSAGNALLYSTFFGGSGEEYGYSVVLDGNARPHVCGRTSSSNLPLMNPADGSYGGAIDAFVCSFANSGAALRYSSFVGGSGEDIGLGIAIDNTCTVYAAGYTKSGNYPTVNPYDAALGGTADAFVIKTLAYKCGDFNGDGFVDVADIVSYQNYFITGTGIPCPIEASDVNGDGLNLTVTDLVYLVNYVSGNGPAPICP